jgi:hypothetical protein
MASWLPDVPRINYELRVLPLLRTTLLGGVFATLAVLAGFAAREPAQPRLARMDLPARGPLIDAAEHPEWKQFLVQAAYARADALDRLRELPQTPASDDKVAMIAPFVDDRSEEITGAVEEKPGVMPLELGEASSTELPLAEYELMPPVQRPESLKLQNDSQRKARPRLRARLKSKPPAVKPAEPDLLTRIFGSPAQ